MKLKLKHYSQKKDYTCGPTCLKMVLEYYGTKISRAKIIKLCKTTRKEGTTNKNMVKAARELGFNVFAMHERRVTEVTRNLHKGYPVIVSFTDPKLKDGHYSVVIGYHQKKKQLVLADPYHGVDHTHSLKEFSKYWHNHYEVSKKWMMVITPKVVLA